MIGGIAIIAIAAAIIFIILRKRRKQQQVQQYEEEEKPELFVQTTPHHPSLSPYYPPTVTAPSGDDSFRSGNGSDYVPLSPRSDTTAGFAGLGTNAAGALHVANPAAGYAASTHTMAYAADAYENTAMAPVVHSGSPAPSSKAREVALNRTHHYAPSLATSSNVGGSQAGSASSRDPLSPGTATGSISSTDVLGLRAEVENLRRVMQEIRAERLEPPPEYVEE